MSLPAYAEFIAPLLDALARNPDGMTVRAAYDAVALALALTDVERGEMLESGKQPSYENVQIGAEEARAVRN